MLKTLLSGLESDESVTINLSRDKKGAARVILTGKIDFDPDEKDEALRQLRSALARPLVVRLDRDEDPDEVLREAITSFSSEQRSSRDTLRDYKADQVSSRAVAQKASADSPQASESKASEAPKEKPASSSNPAPEPESADTNPSSLL